VTLACNARVLSHVQLQLHRVSLSVFVQSVDLLGHGDLSFDHARCSVVIFDDFGESCFLFLAFVVVADTLELEQQVLLAWDLNQILGVEHAH
jgi:hypothetical protein